MLVDVEWDVSGSGVGLVFSSGQVECDIQELDSFCVGLDCYFQAIICENITQIFFDEFSSPWRCVGYPEAVMSV